MHAAVALEPEIVADRHDGVGRLERDAGNEAVAGKAGVPLGGASRDAVDASLVRSLENQQRVLVRGESHNPVAVLAVDLDGSGILAGPRFRGLVGGVVKARGIR